MVVTVTEHCDECKTLKSDVQMREANSYWPKYSLKQRCCAGCFEAAKSKAAAEASETIYGYC